MSSSSSAHISQSLDTSKGRSSGNCVESSIAIGLTTAIGCVGCSIWHIPTTSVCVVHVVNAPCIVCVVHDLEDVSGNTIGVCVIAGVGNTGRQR